MNVERGLMNALERPALGRNSFKDIELTDVDLDRLWEALQTRLQNRIDEASRACVRSTTDVFEAEKKKQKARTDLIREYLRAGREVPKHLLEDK